MLSLFKKNLTILIAILAPFLSWEKALTQITPDNSLGSENSEVRSIDELRSAIEGGAIRGDNLFHSFEQFNIPQGTRVDFSTTEGIANIFSRITGGDVSNIFGTLGVEGSANLFLINPNGIVFGENARLDVGGSFLATTAESIEFNSGDEFNSVTRNEPLLTIDFPVGLGFGSNPGTISVKGQGHNLDSVPFLPVIRDSNSPQLSVQPKKSLALVGGSIVLEGGILKSEGNIHLGSVEGNSVVDFKPELSGWTFDYKKVSSFRDINLFNNALIDGSGIESNSIQLRGKNIVLNDSSVILNQNTGSKTAGNIDINAANSLSMSNTDLSAMIPNEIRSETTELGKGGDIIISTQQLSLQDGGRISNFSFGSAPGGDISINASKKLSLDGFSPLSPDIGSDILTSTFNLGNSGNIAISAGEITVVNGSSITSSTFGNGSGGNVNVNVTELVALSGIELSTFNPSDISAITFSSGEAGDVTIDTSSLKVSAGGRISSSTLADGSSGSVSINASDSIEINGNVSGSVNPSLITSSANLVDQTLQQIFGLPPLPSGESGNLSINTGKLKITDGATINARNDGTGDGGELTINANSIALDNGGNISASTLSGEGGNINIDTSSLDLANQSQISASAEGQGNGGNITIEAQTITASGNSDITANAILGNGGNVEIESDVILGINRRDRLTPLNDITADSELGIDGTVEINSPETNADDEIVVAPIQVNQIPIEIVQSFCDADLTQQSRLIINSSILSETPASFIDYSDRYSKVIQQMKDSAPKPATSFSPFIWQPGDPIVEPNSIVVGGDGTQALVASDLAEAIVTSSLCQI